jgi:hypothetical protein
MPAVEPKFRLHVNDGDIVAFRAWELEYVDV